MKLLISIVLEYLKLNCWFSKTNRTSGFEFFPNRTKSNETSITVHR